NRASRATVRNLRHRPRPYQPAPRLHLRRSLRIRPAALPAGISTARGKGPRPSGGLLGKRQPAGVDPMNDRSETPLLEAIDLVKHFPLHGGILNREKARVHA